MVGECILGQVCGGLRRMQVLVRREPYLGGWYIAFIKAVRRSFLAHEILIIMISHLRRLLSFHDRHVKSQVQHVAI